MQVGDVSNFKNFALDYSFVRQYAGTNMFRDFFILVSDNQHNVYVGKDFKLLHHSVVHQSDDKDNAIAVCLRDLFSVLFGCKRLHTIDVVASSDFIRELNKLDDICLITTKNGILYKRMFEKKLQLDKPILLVSDEETTLYNNSSELYTSIPEREISPLASKNTYLDAHVFCNVGDTVTTQKKKEIVLSSRISNGAEGMIFRTEDPRIVAKVYHRGVITPLRWSKLTKMVSMGINSAEICWPRDLLYFKGVPVGYTMRLGKGSTLSNILDGPDAVMNAFPDWKRIDVVDTLINLLEKYIYMHMHDIIIGDIQLKNALLYSSSSVYLIDMDSSQTGNLPCPVGTEEFTPPEIWGQNFATFLRTLAHEDYCIAMLVFSVLFCGLHPYARRNGKETLREEILEKTFPYRLDNSNVEEIPVGGYNYIWEYLPENIRVMLYDVFALGKRHETIEWYDAVLDYKDMLLNKKYADEESYKVFPKMNYKKPVQVEEVKQGYVKGNNSFKSRVIYTEVNNPFASAANSTVGSVSPFSNPDKPVFASNNSSKSSFTSNKSNSPFVSNSGSKPSTSAFKPVTPPEPPKKGGLFSRFNKDK